MVGRLAIRIQPRACRTGALKKGIMKNRAEWLSFSVFVVAVLVALYLLVRQGVHGQSAALALVLLIILFLRVGMFVWNLRRQRKSAEKVD